MNPVLYHLVGGPGFLAGAVLVPAGLAAAAWGRGRASRLLGRLAIFAGPILVAASATPLPIAVLVGLAVTSLAAVGVLVLSQHVSERTRRIAIGAAILAWGVAIGVELPWHFTPRLGADDQPRLIVIGDSVSAPELERAWPELLAKSHGIAVENLAAVGATAGSSIERARTIEGLGVVVVEIGGNDVLGGTTPVEFERRLDELLETLAAPGRTLVMFELPLPPTYERFGRIQRSLARRHAVRLVPRRVLLGAFTTEGATLDSIHLTKLGHERMAVAVWEVVAPAFATHAER